MKKMLVYLADGFEETEAIVPIDMMKRAGIEVVTSSITESLEVTGAHGITVKADMAADESDEGEYDGVFLPGGMPGALNLSQSLEVNMRIIGMASEGKLVSAICASPSMVLANAGLLEGKDATCFPGCESMSKKTDWKTESVVVDGNMITGKAAGPAFDFAHALIEYLVGKEEADKVLTGVYYEA